MSLKADREKSERIKKEKEALKLQEEAKLKELQQIESKRMEKLERKKFLAANLAPEPDSTIKEKATINIRLPSGSRLVRRFPTNAPLKVNLINLVAI